MVAFSFQKQFAEPIIAGTKRQTIRARARAKPGDRLQLYTGMRTKACRKIGDAICHAVRPIRIVPLAAGGGFQIGDEEPQVIGWELNAFARADGFADWAALAAFFAKHHPGVETFEGCLTIWRDFTPATILPAKSCATAAAPAARRRAK